jgi:hypothetical protein
MRNGRGVGARGRHKDEREESGQRKEHSTPLEWASSIEIYVRKLYVPIKNK